MCSLWLKNSISYNSCRYFIVIPSVGFNIDRVKTQHTPQCVENCSDNKVLYNCLSNFYQIFCKLGYNSENSVFSQPWTKFFVMIRCLTCAHCTLHRRDALIKTSGIIC